MRSRLIPSALALALLSFAAVHSATLLACTSRAQSASERLRDAVVGYNDELRFGRSDLAVQRVSPEYRGEFVGSHYRWTRGIDIADHEIVNVEAYGEEGDRAVSFVTYRWTTSGTMIVRESLVRQEWRKQSTIYLLTSERVIDGDPLLLSVPEGFRAEASALIPEPDAGVPDAAAAPAPASP